MKPFFILYIVIFISLLIFLCQIKIIEPFVSNKTIILVGDSILHNNIYTSHGNGVCELIKERYTNTICYAVDDSKIIDVYKQLDKILISFNNSNTFLFLSIGANDLLFYYKEQNSDLSDFTILMSIFSAYKNLIKSIQTKLPNCKLILLDVYYPTNLQYKPFYTLITKWNKMLYAFVYSNSLDILKISTILTHETDFSFNIEPSDTGSQKIADNILLY
jgi:hypothetical protein